MILQLVRFSSRLSLEEVMPTLEQRAEEFRAVPGLRQKLYMTPQAGEEGEFAGLYVWDSKEDFERFQGTELRRSIPEAYQVEGPVEVNLFDVVKILREGVIV